MENKDDLQIEGRVTRSLRKRLTSIDSDGNISRPGTPIATKLPPISESISPKKRTRRYSGTNTSPTPSKTPSGRKRTPSSLRLDITPVENSPLRRCTRRLSANISVIKEEQWSLKEGEKSVRDEKSPNERVTRSTTKSPQGSKAVTDKESNTNLKSSPKKREESKKNSTKSQLQKRSPTLDDDHSDIEVINLADDSNVTDSEKKHKGISSAESTVTVSDANSSLNSKKDEDKTIKLEETAKISSPISEEYTQSKADEELKSKSEGNEISHSQSENRQELVDTSLDKSNSDGNDGKELKESNDMFTENKKSDIGRKSLASPEKRGQSLIIEVLELNTLNSQHLAELMGSANNSAVDGHGSHRSVSFKQSTEEINEKSSYPKTPRISKSKPLLQQDFRHKEADKSAHAQELIDENGDEDLADKENILKSVSAKEELSNDDSKTPFKTTLNKMQSSTPIPSKISASHEPPSHAVPIAVSENSREHSEQSASDLLSMAPKEIMPNNDDKPSVNDKTDDIFPENGQSNVKHLEQPRVSSAVGTRFSTSALDDNNQESKSSPADDKSIISRPRQNISFPSSWTQNVAASAEVGSKIDNISSEIKKAPIISKTTNDVTRTEESKLEPTDDIDQSLIDEVGKVVSEEEFNTVDLDSVSGDEVEMLTENENPCNTSVFVFDEAEDAGEDYKSGDSMGSDERREIIENEISDDGETIPSESTYDEEEEEMENEGDGEGDSFIDYEEDHYSQGDSGGDGQNYSKIQTKNSSSKVYKRISLCSSTSEEEEEEDTNIPSLSTKDTKAPSVDKHKNDSFTIADSETSLESSSNKKPEFESNQKSSTEKLCSMKSFTSKNKDESLVVGSIEREEQDSVEKTSKASNINLNRSNQVGNNEKAKTADVDDEKELNGLTDEVSDIDGNITESVNNKSESLFGESVRNSSIPSGKEENNVDQSFNEDRIKKLNFSQKLSSKRLHQSERFEKSTPVAQINKLTKSLSVNNLPSDHSSACRNTLSLGDYQTSKKSLRKYHSKKFPSAAQNDSRNRGSSNDSTDGDSDCDGDDFQIFKYDEKKSSSSAEASVCSYQENKENKTIEDEERRMSTNEDSNKSSIGNCDEDVQNEIEVEDNKNHDISKKYLKRRQSHPVVPTRSEISNCSRIGEVSTISVYDTEEESDSRANGTPGKPNNKDRKSTVKKLAPGLSVSLSKVNEIKKSSSAQTEIAHSSFTIGITVNSKARVTKSHPLFPLQSSSDSEEQNLTSGSSGMVFKDSDGEEITNLKNSRASGKLSTESSSRRQSRTINSEAILKEIETNDTEEPVGEEPEEPNLVSEAITNHAENELVERETTKRKRPSDSYCSGDLLDTTASEMNLCKKSRRISNYGALEKCLATETPIEKSSKNSDANNKDHIQKILGRCDEILEAANRAKLEAKLNYQKSKVRIPKQKKRKEIVKDTDKCTTEVILTEEDKTRREKAKKEIEGALKASKDIILKNPVNRVKPVEKSKDNDEQLISFTTLPQRKKEMEKELTTITESNISHKNTPLIKKLKSSAGEVTEMPLKKIKKKAPEEIQLSTGIVRVEEITPTKHGVHNNFRESPVTPRTVGFKVRHIMTAGQDIPPDIPTESNKRYKRKPTIEEPQKMLPKPQWTQSGVFIEENLYPTKPIACTESTQFLVSALSGSRRVVKKSPPTASGDSRAMDINFDNSSAAHNFKRTALFRCNIPRESSHDVVLRKKRQHFRNNF